MDTKQKDSIEKSILLLPLIAAFLWMGFVVVANNSSEAAAKLSPSLLDSYINVLFGFIIIYAIVLTFLFIRMNKKMKSIELEHNIKKIESRIKKKSRK